MSDDALRRNAAKSSSGALVTVVWMIAAGIMAAVPVTVMASGNTLVNTTPAEDNTAPAIALSALVRQSNGTCWNGPATDSAFETGDPELTNATASVRCSRPCTLTPDGDGVIGVGVEAAGAGHGGDNMV